MYVHLVSMCLSITIWVSPSRVGLDKEKKSTRECIPERATMSVCERPRFWKVEMRVGTVEFGEGKPFVAACLLAVLLSLLPTFTSQLGPPDFKNPI